MACVYFSQSCVITVSSLPICFLGKIENVYRRHYFCENQMKKCVMTAALRKLIDAMIRCWQFC